VDVGIAGNAAGFGFEVKPAAFGVDPDAVHPAIASITPTTATANAARRLHVRFIGAIVSFRAAVEALHDTTRG
jgi:hypothetical protein